MTAMWAPSFASAWQMRCASPPLPPVTSATVPFRSMWFLPCLLVTEFDAWGVVEARCRIQEEKYESRDSAVLWLARPDRSAEFGLRDGAGTVFHYGSDRIRRGLAGRTSFLDVFSLPVGTHDGNHGGRPHKAAADRHCGLTGAVLQSTTPGRGGGAAGRAVRRAGELGGGARVRAERVRRVQHTG